MLGLLGMVARLGPENILHKHGRYILQNAERVHVRNSWFTATRSLCQQYSLPEQIKAGGVLKVRIFIKNGPQDQRSTGASWFDDDSLLQLCFSDMMVHNFHNFVFEGLVPIC